MRANWEKWTDEQIGVELAGTPEELRGLANALVELSRDPEQHFHVRETGKASTRVADVEFSVLSGALDDSLAMTSFALAPGTEVRDPLPADVGRSPRARSDMRTIAAVLLLAVAAVCAADAFVSTYATVAAHDFRDYLPLLQGGVQAGCLAFVLLQAAALVAKGGRLRLVALLGSIVAVQAVLGVVGRLIGLARHM